MDIPSAHEEAERKLAYIERELKSKTRTEGTSHLKATREDIFRRFPELKPKKKVNPFIAKAAKKNPLIAKLLAQGKIG